MRGCGTGTGQSSTAQQFGKQIGEGMYTSGSVDAPAATSSGSLVPIFCQVERTGAANAIASSYEKWPVRSTPTGVDQDAYLKRFITTSLETPPDETYLYSLRLRNFQNCSIAKTLGARLVGFHSKWGKQLLWIGCAQINPMSSRTCSGSTRPST